MVTSLSYDFQNDQRIATRKQKDSTHQLATKHVSEKHIKWHWNCTLKSKKFFENLVSRPSWPKKNSLRTRRGIFGLPVAILNIITEWTRTGQHVQKFMVAQLWKKTFPVPRTEEGPCVVIFTTVQKHVFQSATWALWHKILNSWIIWLNTKKRWLMVGNAATSNTNGNRTPLQFFPERNYCQNQEKANQFENHKAKTVLESQQEHCEKNNVFTESIVNWPVGLQENRHRIVPENSSESNQNRGRTVGGYKIQW